MGCHLFHALFIIILLKISLISSVSDQDRNEIVDMELMWLAK